MKKHIVTILIPALLCLLAAGCKQQAPDPLRDALDAYILQGREGAFRLLSIEKIDSTTFRTEFERRQNVFDLKLREETKLYESYVQQRKPRNAARHLGAIQRTNAAVKGLDSLRAALEGRLDEVAYYEYVFSGRVDTDNAYTEFSNTYASITPSLEVITLAAERKDLHNAGGRAIPGYVQMFGKESDED